MNRLCAALLACTAAFSTARAAEVTRIATAFEEDRPFAMFFDVGFDRVQRRMLISREWHNGTDVEYAKELRYTGVDTRLNIDAHIGLWHDVEFAVGVPIDFAFNETWWFAAGTNQSNSTIVNNCLQANGQVTDPSCATSGVGARPLFPLTDGRTDGFRGGIGNLRFGLRYAFFNQKKDDTKPTWVVGFDYEAPTADKLDPTVVTSADARGKVGDRLHKFTLWTAFSRQMGIAEPYFKAYYTLPWHGPFWYSNCDHPDPTYMSHPENCLAPGTPWTRVETGLVAPQQTGMSFGSEFTFYNMPEKHQRVSFDLRAVADYVSAGRYYNEMSGVLHKLLWTDDYMKFGGSFSLFALASEYVNIRATGTLLYATDHYLTDEAMGQDLDGDGTISILPNSSGKTPEMNPNFDYRYDMTSRRFRASEINEFRIDITATFAF